MVENLFWNRKYRRNVKSDPGFHVKIDPRFWSQNRSADFTSQSDPGFEHAIAILIAIEKQSGSIAIRFRSQNGIPALPVVRWYRVTSPRIPPPLPDLTPEKFCFGSTSLPCPLPFLKWPYFSKRSSFLAIP